MATAHVLVVDDDKAIVKVLRSYLEQAGFKVSTALDGEHALHLLRSERPDLSLAEAAQLPLDLQVVDLGALVGETAGAFELLAGEKGIGIDTQVAPGLPPIWADRVRVRQVLHNLLANALRHTPSGGTVTVSAQAQATGVALSVADTGDGIDAQALPHVFDRFYRTDPSRSRETGGSGLGLAIVKALVETQGGSVEAASPGVGQGSIFTLHFPYAQPRALMAS